MNPPLISVPGSKSYTNRAFLVASLAKGKSILEGCLESDDTKIMKKALMNLGIRIKKSGDQYEIRGNGGIFKKPRHPLFLANAGTAVRFLTAVLATQTFESIVTGDTRMQERPIGDLVQALRSLGAKIQYLKKNGFPPIKIHGPLRGGTCSIPGNISSQFLSGLLMASPLVKNGLNIRVSGKLVSKPYADMTREVMKKFGISGKAKKYSPTHYRVEGDASSAGYFWGLAALLGETIGIKNIPSHSRQADLRFLNVLKKMGCIVKKNQKGIWVIGPKQLQPLGRIHLNDMPDAAMIVAVLCAFASGISTLYGLENLRVKESDRLHALKNELSQMGVKVHEFKDGLQILGNPCLSQKIQKEISIKTYHDHRMAMAFGMAQAKIPQLKILQPDCVKKTYPNFWNDLRAVKHKLFAGKNIILTGMRGSGKTTLAKLLAKHMKRPFYDVDRIIEKECGMTIRKIVQRYSWLHFRKLEKYVVQKISKRNGCIVSSGGGTMVVETNVKRLKKNGVIVFLYAPINILKKRLAKDYFRPSLTGRNFLKELAGLWKQRKSSYFSTADWVVTVKDQSAKQNLKPLLRIFR